MAYGTPPIVTNSGGSPELVAHERSGLVVPVKDAKAIAGAISRLYYNDKLRVNLGLNAKKRINDDFSNEATVEKTLIIYQQLLY